MSKKIITLDQFKQLATKVKTEDDALGAQISEVAGRVENLIATGGEPNVLNGVKVNGTALTITDKMVDILIASGEENGTISVNGAAVAVKGLADLAYKSEISEADLDEALLASIAAKATNADLEALTVRVGNIEAAGYQTAEQVQTAIQAAIAASGHAHFEEVDAVPSAEDAQENVMYLVMNDETGHYDIYAKVGDAVVLLDDTTVDLSAYAKTADVTAAIQEAIAGLNIDQYATDTELAAAVARIAAVEAKFDDYYTAASIDTMLANYYTKSEIDTALAAKMNVADMGTYATDDEAAAAAAQALADAKTYADTAAANAVTNAQATDAEVEQAMNEVWTPSEG